MSVEELEQAIARANRLQQKIERLESERDAALARAVAEAVAPYPLCEGDYKLVQERARLAEQKVRELTEDKARAVEGERALHAGAPPLGVGSLLHVVCPTCKALRAPKEQP